MEPAGWSALAAWVALALSAMGLFLPWWRTRRASPSVDLELFNFRGRKGEWQEEVRVVVRNHGPADMRKVMISVVDAEGESLAAELLWPPLPVERVHSGQTLPLKLDPDMGSVIPFRANIRWRDKRLSEQQKTFQLTYRRVF